LVRCSFDAGHAIAGVILPKIAIFEQMLDAGSRSRNRRLSDRTRKRCVAGNRWDSANITIKRFSALLVDSGGEVDLFARFYSTDSVRTAVEGTVKTRVRVVCQRCMADMMQDIDSTFSFAFVTDDGSADELDSDYDPLMHDENQEISAVDFIEDELILQMPFRSVHASDSDCDQSVIGSVPVADAGDTAKTHNPFSELGELLKK